MQKALTQMNLQLANVISDLAGVTGQAIVRANVAGERDPIKLAALTHPRTKASREQIADSLHGSWRDELVFVSRSLRCTTPTNNASRSAIGTWRLICKAYPKLHRQSRINPSLCQGFDPREIVEGWL